MPGLLAIFWIIIQGNYSKEGKEKQETLVKNNNKKKKWLWLFCFSWSSHLPILISIQREGSSPCQVRENVHEHMAACEDMSQPLHNLRGQKNDSQVAQAEDDKGAEKILVGEKKKSVHPIWLTGKCLSKLSKASPVTVACTETPLHEAISAACWCIKRIITYTHQDLVHKIEMLALFCARKHSQHGASRGERKALNSQHEAGKEMESRALKSRKINRAEPKFVKFVWLSSPRPPPPCGICWLGFRSKKIQEKFQPEHLAHGLCSLSNCSAGPKTTCRNSNGILKLHSLPPMPASTTAWKFLRLFHPLKCVFFFVLAAFLNWSGTITVLPTHKSSWKQALLEKKKIII